MIPHGFEGGASRKEASSWNILSDQDPSVFHAAYRELCGILRSAPLEERRSLLRQIRDQLPPTGSDPGLERPMSVAEIQALNTSEWVSIGAHTIHHPSLANQDRKTQEDEIRQSRKILESIIGEAVLDFAYPYGEPQDYSPGTIELVASAGYRSAFANKEGAVHRSTSLYEIPRFVVRDWTADELDRRLRQWFRIR